MDGFGPGFCFGIGLCLILSIPSCGLERRNAAKEVKVEAVKAGVAKWVPQENGEIVFEWIKPAEKAK